MAARNNHQANKKGQPSLGNHSLQLTLQRTKGKASTRLISHVLEELCKQDV